MVAAGLGCCWCCAGPPLPPLPCPSLLTGPPHSPPLAPPRAQCYGYRHQARQSRRWWVAKLLFAAGVSWRASQLQALTLALSRARGAACVWGGRPRLRPAPAPSSAGPAWRRRLPPLHTHTQTVLCCRCRQGGQRRRGGGQRRRGGGQRRRAGGQRRRHRRLPGGPDLPERGGGRRPAGRGPPAGRGALCRRQAGGAGHDHPRAAGLLRPGVGAPRRAAAACSAAPAPCCTSSLPLTTTPCVRTAPPRPARRAPPRLAPCAPALQRRSATIT